MKLLRKLFRTVFVKYRYVTWGGVAVLVLWWWFSLPAELFPDPVSTVVEDRDGNLIGARIAADGQWRFPHNDSVPEKFKAAIIAFEDERFFAHPGVDPLAFGRAIIQNIRNGEVVSGGSTLSMQVIRMMRKGKPRNIWQKMIEASLAMRLEFRYDKEEILALYASNAPFGGNVVGLDAAAWRYFGRSPYALTWAETATLAVLPNSPALVHPGKNREILRGKRDRLLDKLQTMGILDSLDCRLSKLEPLIGKPHPLPNLAPHLVDRIQTGFLRSGSERAKTRVRTTIDGNLQRRAESLMKVHQHRLKENQIYNAAAIIAEVESGDVLAYIGNLPSAGEAHGQAVNVIHAPRSTGSVIKPFLYAAMMDEGELLPKMLVPDIPTYFGSYSPQNYYPTYDGAVPAANALARSLNVPAVRLLSQYGHLRMYEKLKRLGMTSLNRSAGNYGLSLMLGGAEGKLWDLAGMYAGLAKTVVQYNKLGYRYGAKPYRGLNYHSDKSRKASPIVPARHAEIGAGAAYLTLEALLDVARPGLDNNWRRFASSRRIAWKTGTSFGFRDAWAIGVTPRYVVAVWAGNADGEGRPGLVGFEAAAPILFDLFSLLDNPPEWFKRPEGDMEKMVVCRHSGHQPSPWCQDVDSVWSPASGRSGRACPYHRMVHLDQDAQFRLHSECASPLDMKHESWFVLPPAMETYYQLKHAEYKPLPPFREDCIRLQSTEGSSMEFLYPRGKRKIFIPIKLNGEESTTVFEIAHRDANAVVYWHLDGTYLGSTETFHQMGLNPKAGEHILVLVDDKGERLERTFEIAARE